MREKIFNSNFIRISIASILLQSGNQIIMVVLPLFLQALGCVPSVLGIATSLSALAAMISRPISGFIADKKSRKLVMILGLSIMIVGMIGFNVFPFAVAIILIRFVQGFGISAATTAQMAIATDVLPVSKTQKGLSYFGMCTTLAGAFGPALGLSLISGSNYFPAWFGGAVVFVLALMIISTFTYEKSIIKEVPSNYPKMESISFWRYFERDAILPSLVQMVLMIANSGAIVFLPTYATEIGIQDIGLFYTLQACSMLVANIIVGNLIDRVRNPNFFLLPAIVCFGGSLFTLFINTGTILFYMAAVLYGIGLGISTLTISVITMYSAVLERRGAASATYQCAGDTGYCLGSLIWGVVAGVLGYRSLYGILFLLSVFAAVMSIFIFGLKKRPEKKDPD